MSYSIAATAHSRFWHSTAVRRGAASGQVLEMLRTLGTPRPDLRP
jgi:hypothetical protein